MYPTTSPSVPTCLLTVGLSFKMDIQYVEDKCCVLFQNYLTSDVGGQFEAALAALCESPHCKTIFEVVVEGAPFVLREVGHLDTPSSFEAQCAARKQMQCTIHAGPSSGKPFRIFTPTESDLERECLNAFYLASANRDLLVDLELGVDAECCQTASRYAEISIHNAYLQVWSFFCIILSLMCTGGLHIC